MENAVARPKVETVKKKLLFGKKRSVHELSGPWNLIFNIIMTLFTLLCIFPFIYVIIISLTSEDAIKYYGYSIFPAEWSFEGYKYLWSMKGQLLQSLSITLFVTIVGTILTVLLTSSYAYAISRQNFKYRKFFTFFALFTMLFSGGMVPTYIVVTQFLGLKDSIWALILPMCLSPFYIIVMRTFFKRAVHDSIIESARIDGASELRIFFQIAIPLALPGIATIGLFSTLGYWNDWFNALLYVDSSHLVPLQYMLMKIQNTMDFISQSTMLSGGQTSSITNSLPQESTRMAMVVV
ncbi:MAG: carbohydrate ABC transporter permease, partial [Bacilli bacterium]